jgi:hypothetical protein
MRATITCHCAWKEPVWLLVLTDVAGRVQRDREYVWQSLPLLGKSDL